MGCCSGRATGPGSDMEPKSADPAKATAVVPDGGNTSNTTSNGSNTTATKSGDAGAPASTPATTAAAAVANGTGPEGSAAPPVGKGRASRSGSILKREHDKAWNDYFGEAMKATEVAELKKSLTGGSGGADAAAPAVAVAVPTSPTGASDAKFAAARKSMIEIVGRQHIQLNNTLSQKLGSIFDSYDKNHSGDLDEPELKRVLEDYLVESKSQMQKLSESLFAEGGEICVVLASTGKTADEQKAELTKMKDQFATKMSETVARLDKVHAASAEFAKQLLADLDRNGDGHVSRGEFIRAFQEQVESMVSEAGGGGEKKA